MLKYKVLSQKILKYPWPAKRFLLLMTYSVSCIRPYFISVSPDQRILPGGSVKLKCIAGGNPLPRLAWLLNGEVLVSLKYLWRIYLLNITQCSILLRSYALNCLFCEDKDLKLEHAYLQSQSSCFKHLF